MSLDLADINHLKIALSNSSYFPALTFFLFKLIIPDENAAIISPYLQVKAMWKLCFLISYTSQLLMI